MFSTNNPKLNLILWSLASMIAIYQIFLVHKKKEKYTLFPFFVTLSYVQMAGVASDSTKGIPFVIFAVTSILQLVYLIDMFLVQPYKATLKDKEPSNT